MKLLSDAAEESRALADIGGALMATNSIAGWPAG